MQADMALSYSHHVEGSLLGVQPRNQVEHLTNSPSKGLNLSCNFCWLIWERVFDILRYQNYFDYDRFFTHFSKFLFFNFQLDYLNKLRFSKENWKKL